MGSGDQTYLLNNDIPSFGSQRHRNRLGQDVHTGQHGGPSLIAKSNLFMRPPPTADETGRFDGGGEGLDNGWSSVHLDFSISLRDYHRCIEGVVGIADE